MPESFDPYHKWLGISPKDRPVTYYRLLGIELFEDDPQVIDVAADRQMSHLRSFQTGPQGPLSQKLLNEIAAARLCLLNAEKKAAYDQKLKAATKPVAKALPVAAPLAQQAPERKPTLVTRQEGSASPGAQFETPDISAAGSHLRKSKPIWQQPIAWSVALGAVLLLIVGLIFLPGKPEPTEVATNENPEVAAGDHQAASTGPVDVQVSDPGEKQDPEVAQVTPQPTDTSIESPPSSATTEETADTATESPVNEKPKVPDSAPESPSNSIDLLKAVDLKRDVVGGTWELESGELVCQAGDGDRIELGPTVPERYQLDIEFQHVKGLAACIGLVIGDHQAMLLMNMPAHGGVVNGIHQYQQFYLQDHTQSFPKEIYTSEPVLEAGHGHLVCLVEPGRIWVACNGKQVVNRSGDLSDLTLYPNWRVPNKDRIFLGAYQANVRFERAVLTPLKSWPKVLPTGKEPLPAASIAKEPIPDETSPDESPAKTASMPKGTDLLKPIDVKRDVIHGNWQIEDGELISQAGEASRVVVGPALPDRYRLDIDYQHVTGAGAAIGLVVGDHHTLLLLNIPAHGGVVNGIHQYRQSFLDHSTEGVPKGLYSREPLLEDRKGHLVCLVEPGKIWVTCNGKDVVNWSGDFSELGLFDAWQIPDKNRIFLGAHQAVIRYERAVLTPLRSWPKSMPSGNEPLPTEAVAGQPIPDEAAQQAVKAQLKEVFEKEYKQTQPEGKAALARQLVNEAIRSSLDSPERFVMFHEGALLAAEAGDPKLFGEALTPLALDYDDPEWKLPLELFAHLASNSKSIEARESFSTLAIEWSRRAVKVNQYDAALKLAGDAASAAARSKDIDARKRAAAFRDWVQQVQSGWKSADDALKVLKETPDDPGANLTVGKFLSFSKQDWSAGLAHLAKGSDQTLQQLAAEDLKNPGDDAARLALADHWWEASEKLKDFEKKAAEDRAAHWYLQAEPQLQGLEQARVGKKLREMGVIVDVLSMIKPSRTNARGNWLYDKKVLVSPADPMAAVQFPYKPPTEYDIILTAQRIKSQESIEYGQDAFVFGLSHAGTQFLLVADWYVHGRAKDLAIYAANGEGPGDRSPLHTYASIFGEKPVTVIVKVRNDRISVEADGKELANWKVDYSKLSLPKEWTPADREQLFLGSHKCNFRITQFDVVQVTR